MIKAPIAAYCIVARMSQDGRNSNASFMSALLCQICSGHKAKDLLTGGSEWALHYGKEFRLV